MPARIVVAGSLNMDLVVRSARMPAAGETLLGECFDTFPGGKGANQAVACARLGASVAMIGRVGADDFGLRLVGGARADGVAVEHISTDEHVPTGVALISIDAFGQNTIVVVPGANGRLSPRHIHAAEAAFAGAAVVVAQLEVPLEAVAAAMALGKRHGALTVLNPAPAQALPPDLLALVDYLIPNQPELALLSGTSEPEAGVRALRDQGARGVVVTLGAEGALLALPGQPFERVPAFPVKTVDTVAAGDAFVGAFAVALAEGQDVRAAVRFGNAAGALAVTQNGAQPALPMRGEVERMLSEG